MAQRQIRDTYVAILSFELHTGFGAVATERTPSPSRFTGTVPVRCMAMGLGYYCGELQVRRSTGSAHGCMHVVEDGAREGWRDGWMKGVQITARSSSVFGRMSDGRRLTPYHVGSIND